MKLPFTLKQLRDIAKTLDTPSIRKAFQENLRQEGFKERVDELAKEIEDLCQHEESPDERGD